MSTVPTSLGPLHVEVTGDGPPAVLWHSLFVDSTTWGRLRPRLAAQRQLILIDAPGHGANPDPGRPFTMDECAAAGRDVLDNLKVSGPVDWLGNAWGGHVGVVFAATNPPRCRSLLTIASPMHALAAADRRQVALLHRLYRLGGPRPVAGLLTDALLGKDFRRDNAEAAAIVKASFGRAGRRGMRRAIESISLNRTDAMHWLPSVKAPTLMVTGVDDSMCTPTDTAGWAAMIPHGAVATVAGAGHLTPLFDLATADLILDFWRDPTTGAGRV